MLKRFWFLSLLCGATFGLDCGHSYQALAVSVDSYKNFLITSLNTVGEHVEYALTSEEVAHTSYL